MGRAGVSDEPDILMVALLEESSDRLGATRQAAQTAQEGVSTAGGLLGAATGAVTNVTGSTLGAAAEGIEQAMEAVAFPIEGYDEMNVDEISGRLNEGAAAGSRLRGTQREAQTLLERMDREIRTSQKTAGDRL